MQSHLSGKELEHSRVCTAAKCALEHHATNDDAAQSGHVTAAQASWRFEHG
jgi:hypothetical protein